MTAFQDGIVNQKWDSHKLNLKNEMVMNAKKLVFSYFLPSTNATNSDFSVTFSNSEVAKMRQNFSIPFL